MIKLELTQEEYLNLMLKYEIGKLVQVDVVEEDTESIVEGLKLDDKLLKAGFDGGSEAVIKDEDDYSLVSEVENSVDSMYDCLLYTSPSPRDA